MVGVGVTIVAFAAVFRLIDTPTRAAERCDDDARARIVAERVIRRTSQRRKGFFPFFFSISSRLLEKKVDSKLSTFLKESITPSNDASSFALSAATASAHAVPGRGPPHLSLGRSGGRGPRGLRRRRRGLAEGIGHAGGRRGGELDRLFERRRRVGAGLPLLAGPRPGAARGRLCRRGRGAAQPGAAYGLDRERKTMMIDGGGGGGGGGGGEALLLRLFRPFCIFALVDFHSLLFLALFSRSLFSLSPARALCSMLEIKGSR